MKISIISLCLALCLSEGAAFLAPTPVVARAVSLTIRSSTTTDQQENDALSVDDETALTDAGLLKRDRYIATNRFSVRRNQQAKFEKRWATRKSKLAVLDGFKYFQLMRRVKLQDDKATTVYDEGPTDEDAFENYVSFTIWQKKSNFNAWRNGEAFKEAHGGTSIGAFLSTMVNSAFVLRGAPRPAFYDALYMHSKPPAEVPSTVDGWRQVEADGENTLDAESFMHMTKYYIPAEKMTKFESDYAHVAGQDPSHGVVASALMRRDARAKGHGIKEMTLDEPSYVAVRIFDSKQDWLEFIKDKEGVMEVDYARKPSQVELYEGTLVISSEQGA